MTFTTKRNNTSPAMLATLLDENRDVVILSGSSVRFHMRAIGGELKVDQPATIVTPLEGLVRYDWTASDTDTIGSYKAEFEVTFSDGSVETFPRDSYIRVEIIDTLA